MEFFQSELLSRGIDAVAKYDRITKHARCLRALLLENIIDTYTVAHASGKFIR